MRLTSIMVWSGLWAFWIGGCYSPEAPLGAPCSASQECPDGQECDLLTNVCGYPTEARTLRDDTAAQFEGGTLEDAMIEAGGFVGPIPYFVHGVRTTALTGNRLATSTGITFEELAQIAPAGRGVLRGTDLSFADGTPPLLGLMTGDDITVLVEGELWLDTPGAYGIELRANDLGFIDLAAPGGAFERVGEAAGMTPQLFPYTVSAPGWYRFRGAFADSMLVMEWELRYRVPSSNQIRAIPMDLVRARVDDLEGVVVDGFDEPWLGLHSATGVTDKLDALTFTGTPYGFATGGIYTLRWTAQFLVDVEGDYRFALDTANGHRAWIDGATVANAFSGSAQTTTTNPIHLVAGWHDLVIDAVRPANTGTARYSFSVVDGPQFAGGGIPRDHLRPVSGRGVRFSSGKNETVTDLVDGMTVTRGVGLDLPMGITPLVIDANAQFTHPLQAQVSVVLDPAAGTNVTMVAAGSLAGVGEYAQHSVIPNDRSGASFNFIVGDSTVDTMIGTVDWVSVTTTYSGGRAPYDARAVYTSTVRELDIARFGALTWQMRQAKAEPIVSVRTCDAEADCATTDWTAVLNGETPTVPGRKFFQYKVEIASGGDVPASLDWIDLQYVGYITP